MKTTTAALLLGTAAAPPPVRRVFHPTDLSAASIAALRLAIKIAQLNDAELVLAHVLPPPTPIYEIEPPEREAAEQDLQALAREISSRGIVTKRILIGGSRSVPKNIIECAQHFRADLIVMASQTRRGLERFLRGSITASVIKHAHCPVLVVPARMNEVARWQDVA